MSLIPPETHQQLSLLLQALSSSDNEIRARGEDQLNNEWFAKQPEVLLIGLAEQIAPGNAEIVRSFAAIVFRRMSTKSRKLPGDTDARELYITLPEAQQHAIRATLLQTLHIETSNSVRHKIGDAIAELARQHCDDADTWPELLSGLFQASQSTIEGQRETAFRIFATTPGIIETQHQDAVQTVFNKGFEDPSVLVRIAAMEAFASFFRAVEKKIQKKYYVMAPKILSILPPLKDGRDSDNLVKALIALIEMAELAPIMFKPLFRDLVQFSVQIIQDKEQDDMPRQNALELMATFADYSPAMCKKDPTYANDMVTQCLSMMTDIGMDDEDASEWKASEDLDNEESDLNHVAGEQCMDRLANKLGGPIVLPPTFSWLPRMLQSNGWQERHAALMAISAISEGCRDLMMGELDKVLDMVIPALKDRHPRVQWAGCNALGQMSTDFAGTMQGKYHNRVLPAIIPVLQSPEPRVQAHAAAALVNFCEESEKEVLEPYLDSLLHNLLLLLQSNKRFVQEQALSTIATVADAAESAFSTYYDRLMPLLINVLQGEQGAEYRLLRGKAMECATLIALAVGKERTGHDALKLAQLLQTIQANITEADDPQATYLIHSWGRMCRVLDHDFIPFLPSVMPRLLELASAKADITLLDDDEQIAQYEQEEGWEMIALKGKYIGIKTSLLDEKHSAIELIVIYVQTLEAAFEPYVINVMENIALPGLAFFFHDPVRIASARCVPQLLNSYKKAHGDRSEALAKLWDVTVKKLIEVLTPELAIDTLAEMYQCFYESVEALGKDCLNREHMNSFIDAAKATLEDYTIRVSQRIEARKDDEDGEEISEDILYAIESDQNLLSDMNKAWHTIFKNHGLNFIPAWEKLLPFYDRFIHAADPTQRQWAICIYDDVLEFTGEASFNYQQQIRQPLIDGLRDENASNRQAAAYGIGVVAQKGGAAWGPFVVEVLPLLFQMCSIANARDEESVYATENACAAISKIMVAHGDRIPNAAEVISMWIETLPVVMDEEAAPYAYMLLAQLIDRQDPSVRAKAPKAFMSIVLAFEAETIQGQTAQKVAQSAKLMMTAGWVDAAAVLSQSSNEVRQAAAAYLS